MTYFNATKYIRNSPNEVPEKIAGERLRKLWEYLGNPARKLKYLRLAGSNGKTVCAEMLLSVFKNSEYIAGCFVTPLRSEIRENVKINGTPISFDQMAHYVGQIYYAVIAMNKKIEAKNQLLTEEAKKNEIETVSEEKIVLTAHEILLTAALLAFRDAGCDLCLIESDHDHSDPTRYLPPPFAAAICGTIPSNDKKEISKIRAYLCHGIQEIVSAPQDRDAYGVISETCAAINARLTLPTKTEAKIRSLALGGTEFSYRSVPYRLELCGKFQVTNAIVVLEILSTLKRHGYQLTDGAIAEGLKKTKIPARFEIVSISPAIIVDSTHSDVAIETVCDSMTDFRAAIGTHICLCLPNEALALRYVAVLKQQNYQIERMILFDCPPDSPLFAEIPTVKLCQKAKEAVKYALAELKRDEILLISGSSGFTSKIRRELINRLSFS